MAYPVNVNFQLDSDVKQNMEQVCDNLGLSMDDAFTMFAKKVCADKCIPFEPAGDPFYSESNLSHLRRGVAALNAGHGVAHEMIEDEGA
jgi:DNA-damage-inducible protein J